MVDRATRTTVRRLLMSLGATMKVGDRVRQKLHNEMIGPTGTVLQKVGNMVVVRFDDTPGRASSVWLIVQLGIVDSGRLHCECDACSA